MKNKNNDENNGIIHEELEKLRQRVKELEESRFLKNVGEMAAQRQELLSIFDSIDEPIYVCDPHTYEVLFVNQAIRKRFGQVRGQKCFKAFQNLSSPCPFCTNKYIFGKNLGRTYIWEFQNRVDKNWYRCIDRAIKWPDGRMVRYEIAININDIKIERDALKKEKQRLEKIEEKVLDLQKEVNTLLAALGRKKKY
ncbi:MAG: hypothetical protein NC914_02605 [Candidatus Omnitrophica bacterium]|nr:hypothetical protein [Candidatus Omnitrophota bacterium]